MAQENVGTIYYEVVGDTSKLVNSGVAADGALTKLEASMAKADNAQKPLQANLTKTAVAVQQLGREASQTQGMLSGLSGMFAGLLTGGAILSLVHMAEAYGETSERIRMATKDTAEYEQVQQRLIKTANSIYRPLKEAQETYILTASSLKSMGYTTAETLDITDSLSLSFVKNATATDRAQSAISAFTKSMQTGKVESDSWQSLLAAVPTVVDDIAKSSGKTAEEIRKMGVEGKLSAQMLSEGLRQSFESNEAAAAGMATTVKDAINNVTNNLTVYLGELNKGTGATGLMSQAILAFGNNIELVAKSLAVLGAGALARYVVQTGLVVTQNMLASVAARTAAAEELKLAAARVAATTATLAQAQATTGLIAGSISATAATAQHTAAVAALGVAQRGAAAAGVGMVAMLGGPIGIIGLLAAAAAAMYLFSGSNAAGKVSMDGFSESVEIAAAKLEKMTESQQALARMTATENITKGLDDLDVAANKLISGPFFTNKAGIEWIDASRDQVRGLTAAFAAGDITAGELDKRLVAMVNTYASSNGMSQAWTQRQYEAIAAMTTAAQTTDTARVSITNIDAAYWSLMEAANNAAIGVTNANNALSKVSDAETKALAGMDKAIATFGKSAAAGTLYDIAQARKGLGDMKDFSAETLATLEDNAKKLDALQSRKKGGGGGGGGAKKENAQANAIADVQKQVEAFGKTSVEQKLYAIGQALKGMGSMAKFSKPALKELQEQYTELAALEKEKKDNDGAKQYLTQLKESADEVAKMTSAERLQYDIVAGKVVLNETQLAQATALAATLDERAEKEKQLADSLSIQNASLGTQRQLQAELLKYALAIDGATMGSEARGQMEERASMEQQFAERIQDIQNRRRDAVAKADAKELPRVEKLYDDQLKIEKAYQTKSVEEYEKFIAKKQELDKDWRVGAQRAFAEYTEAAANTSKQSETAFTNFLNNTENELLEFVKTGKFSFTNLANSIITDIARMSAKSVTSGIAGLLGSLAQGYFGAPGGTTPGAGGTTATTGHQVLPGGLSLPGRANGGPVKASSMYRVNEKGTPELLNVGGSKYLMMGNKSGTVDNLGRNAGGGGSGGGGSVTVNVANYTDSKVTTTENQQGDTRVVDILIEAVATDIAKGGRVAGAMQSAYGLNRGAGVPRFVR